MDNNIGRFVSVDPATLILHNQEDFKDKYSRTVGYFLENPQNLNSYSYVLNNPIIHTDPNGEIFDTILDIGFIAYDIGRIASSYIKTGHVEKSEFTALGADTLGAFIPGATGLGLMARTAKVANEADNIVDATKVVTQAKDFDALAQQSKMLKGIENSKAINTIKSVFKPSDTIPGGTIGALKNEIITGNKTKNIFHFGKAQNVINNIENVFKSQNLNKIESNRLRWISNNLKSLVKKVKK